VTRLAEIQARLAGMGELSDVVGAMRSLAGMRMVEAQRTLPGIRRHAELIAGAIAATLSLLPEAEPRRPSGRVSRVLVVCAAEHGFVGGFNERLVEEVMRLRSDDDMLFLLGTRGGLRFFERGFHPVWSRPMATRSRAVTETIQGLASELYRQIAAGRATRVETIYCRTLQAGVPEIHRQLVVPFDPASLARRRRGSAPLHNLASAVLYEKLVAEYVFAMLTEAAVESIASENAARFVAMESARDNIERKLNVLRQQAHEARQSEITTEILELATAGAVVSA
jgi:F-type H+-transporting ATPase subunit gamma